MKHFLITVAAVFVGLALFAVLAPLALVGVLAGASKPAPMAARTVLVLDLRSALPDQASQSPLTWLGGGGL